MLQAVLVDWRTAPIDPKLRATLGFLEKLTLTPAEVRPADIAPLRRAGVTHEAIEDAIQVCALFSVYNRLADALGFYVPTGDGHAALARFVLKRGYLV
ncbi:MAG TPA: hypothetical protein VKH16_09455 [Gemmatimonadales bacterium]|nr:hypothetical protein [Gemmatimonadales bacterium]